MMPQSYTVGPNTFYRKPGLQNYGPLYQPQPCIDRMLPCCHHLQVSQGVTGSMAFAAWDRGFDVWLGTTRCNPPHEAQGVAGCKGG